MTRPEGLRRQAYKDAQTLNQIGTSTMRNVHLYGALGREFGKTHRFEIDTVGEAIDAFRANYSNFVNALRKGYYRVIVGKTTRNGMELDEAMLPGLKLGKQDLHIVPVVKGSKRGGLGKIIAGVALVGLSMISGGAMAAPLFGAGSMTAGTISGAVGASLILNGVASLIAPEFKVEEKQQSFTMTGPQNVTREGGIVPIVYGEVISGGTMISGALEIRHKDENDNPAIARINLAGNTTTATTNG